MTEALEEEKTEDKKENSEFQKFASEALRLHRKGSFETLLAQHLAVATPSDPLSKVRLICEAAYMIPEEKISLDMQQIETIYLVSLSFLNATKEVVMAFGFPLNEESFMRFIKPWHKGIPLFFMPSCEADRMEKSEVLNKTATEAERFWLCTSRWGLYYGSFVMLKAEFLRYAVPFAMQTFEKISKLVDPDVYKEMVGLLKPEAKLEK